jgi:hypothetical protein
MAPRNMHAFASHSLVSYALFTTQVVAARAWPLARPSIPMVTKLILTKRLQKPLQ